MDCDITKVCSVDRFPITDFSVSPIWVKMGLIGCAIEQAKPKGLPLFS